MSLFSYALVSILMMSLSLNGQAFAQDNEDLRLYEEQRKQAIQEVTAFAERICTPSGSQNVENNVSRLTGKLDQLDLDTSSSFSRSQYIGILQGSIEGLALRPVECKNTILEEWLNEFLPPPPPPKYTIRIRAFQGFIDNSMFGPIDDSLSSMEISIDNDDFEYFNFLGGIDMSVRLTEGEHDFFFDADILGPMTSLEDNCQGYFSVSRSATFRPFMKIVAHGYDGSILSCELQEE